MSAINYRLTSLLQSKGCVNPVNRWIRSGLEEDYIQNPSFSSTQCPIIWCIVNIRKTNNCILGSFRQSSLTSHIHSPMYILIPLMAFPQPVDHFHEMQPGIGREFVQGKQEWENVSLSRLNRVRMKCFKFCILHATLPGYKRANSETCWKDDIAILDNISLGERPNAKPVLSFWDCLIQLDR